MKIKIEKSKSIPKTEITWGGKFYLSIMVDTNVSIHQADHKVAFQFAWPSMTAAELKADLNRYKLTKRLSKEFGVEPDQLAGAILNAIKTAFPNGPQWRPGKKYGTWEPSTPPKQPAKQTGGTSMNDIQTAFNSLFS